MDTKLTDAQIRDIFWKVQDQKGDYQQFARAILSARAEATQAGAVSEHDAAAPVATDAGAPITCECMKCGKPASSVAPCAEAYCPLNANLAAQPDERAGTDAAAPTLQQISDYLHGLDAVQREVVEREARALPPSADHFVQPAAQPDERGALVTQINRLHKDEARGDTVFRCGFNSAIDSVVKLIEARATSTATATCGECKDGKVYSDVEPDGSPCPSCAAAQRPQVEDAACGEPVAFEFQHEETGNTTYVDPWQVEQGFAANNPRWQLIGPVYRHAHAAAPLTDDARDAARYRWLRDPENPDASHMVASMSPEELDAAIDAMRDTGPLETGE